MRTRDSDAVPYIGLATLLVVCLAVRIIAIDADPPAWLSWSSGVYTDEGFYTLDARHEALFGAWAPGNFHDRLLSPLLSAMQQGVFTVLGVGMEQARSVSVVFGLLTVGVSWWGLRRAYGERVAVWGALFLGLAPPFAFYNRLALQETPTVFWLVMTWTLSVAGREARTPRTRVLLFALMGAAAAIALLFKPLAVMALPGLALGWKKAPTPPPSGPPSTGAPEGPPRGAGEGPVTTAHGSLDIDPVETAPVRTAMSGSHWPLSRSDTQSCPLGIRGPSGAPVLGGPDGGGVGAALLAFAAVLGVYGLLWYAPHHAELARMGHYYRTHQFQPHSVRSVWLNVRRGLVDTNRGVLPYLLTLLPVPCLLLLGRLRQWDRVLGVWLLGGLAFCLLSSYAPDRYYVLFLPALCGLAAGRAATLPRWGQGLALGLFLVTSGFWYVRAWDGRDWARRDAARTLARTLPAGSVVVGDMAPALCLDTGFRAAPVQPGLSNDDRPVERLGATHVAVTRAPDWRRWWRAHYPDIVQPSHRVLELSLRGRLHTVVDIYQVNGRGR